MSKSLYDSETIIDKSNMVVSEFIYIETATGNVKRFKCLIPQEMTEQISRETELAISSCTKLMQEFD